MINPAFYRTLVIIKGNIGIGTGTIPLNYKMAVDGKIICTELFVQLKNLWPDYVFNVDYKLMPLNELKDFIKINKHLPEIQSQKAIQEATGLQVGEMQTLLVKKIEELSLIASQVLIG